MNISKKHRQTLHPLSSVQREIWFEQSLYPDTPVCNVGGYHRIEGRFDHSLMRIRAAFWRLFHAVTPWP